MFFKRNKIGCAPALPPQRIFSSPLLMPPPAFQLQTPNLFASFYVWFPPSLQHPSSMHPRTRLSPFVLVLHSRHMKQCASCGCVILSRALITLQEAFPHLGEGVTQTFVFLEGSSCSQNSLFPPCHNPACAACSSTLLWVTCNFCLQQFPVCHQITDAKI